VVNYRQVRVHRRTRQELLPPWHTAPLLTVLAIRVDGGRSLAAAHTVCYTAADFIDSYISL